MARHFPLLRTFRFLGLALIGVAITASSLASPDDASWLSRDVGLVGLSGTASHDAGVFGVSGAGADIGSSADAFQFLYQRLDGDGSIIAHIACMQNTDSGAEAGVMIRQGLSADSPSVFIGVTPAKGINFERRTAAGGSSARTAGGAGTAPMWLKLERSGTLLSGYVSADGVTWTLIKAVDVSMSYSAYAGLAVSSHRTNALCATTFDQVSVASPASGHGLSAEYFDEANLVHLALSRVDGSLNFNWGDASPDALIPNDNFSARWQGEIEPQFGELYTFSANTASQVRLWIGDQLVIDDWKTHSSHERSGSIALAAGQRYPLKMEYVAGAGSAVAQLSWSSASQPRQAVPASRLFLSGTAAAQQGSGEIAVSLPAEGTSPDDKATPVVAEEKPAAGPTAPMKADLPAEGAPETPPNSVSNTAVVVDSMPASE